MQPRDALILHAFSLFETEGIAGFSTRAACNLAGVTAPTLYHHFGSADGLLSAAVERGIEDFLSRKLARPVRDSPAEDLLDRRDDYVAFAKDRPHLFCRDDGAPSGGRRHSCRCSGAAAPAGQTPPP